MSRTKARVISSLRMRRCSQRRNKTNCTPAETTAVNTAYQCAGMQMLLGSYNLACSGAACCATTKARPLEKCAWERAERGAQAGAERGEEAAAVAAGGVGADVEEFRWDADRAAEKVQVDAEKTRN